MSLCLIASYYTVSLDDVVFFPLGYWKKSTLWKIDGVFLPVLIVPSNISSCRTFPFLVGVPAAWSPEITHWLVVHPGINYRNHFHWPHRSHMQKNERCKLISCLTSWLLDGTKPLPEPMLTYCLGSLEPETLWSRSEALHEYGVIHGGWHFTIHHDFDTRGR